MTGNGPVRFGGGLMEKEPLVTSPAAYPTKAAILANAAAIVCGHNHPSGDVQPSREDRATTKRLVDAGKLLGIEVLDHIIIGREGVYFSFADENILS
jgi:DNA repair protein RadC